MIIFPEMDILEEKQRRQIEVGKPASTALVTALFQCSGGRTGSHKLHIVVSIHQRFEIDFPIFEILYLVEKHIEFLLAVFLAKYLLCQSEQQFQKNIVIDWCFHRNVDYVLRRNALVYESLDGMIEHYRLAHSARTHQDKRTLNADILHQWVEDVEIEAGSHHLIVGRYLAFCPPRVVYLQPALYLFL